MKSVYHIIEVANTHGGDLKYLNALLDEFSEFQVNFGIKFQPFKFDQIATPDFSWFDTYKELYFTPEEWSTIIEKADQSKNVWLDMFDVFSVQILKENLSTIKGIKLQASVLYNFYMLNALREIDLSKVTVQINISGFEVDEIKSIIDRLNREFSPAAFVIQLGFQNYPTEFNDSGLSKIKTLKENFPGYELCFADHLDGTSEDALIMPLLAVQAGCSYIEKHVYHDQLETKFDQFSSVNYKDYRTLIERIEKYEALFKEDFINARERAYLEKTRQIPILRKDRKTGDLVSIETDIEFKRTDQKGINFNELIEIQSDKYVLDKDKKAGYALQRDDFRKAKLAAIVACRMKSSRLPKKAVLNIGDLTSIELCLKNLLKYDGVDHTILATSTVDEDSQLKDYTFSDDVIFHQGDPEDVVQRYLDIINKLEIDVVIRVTGDCPYVSKDILELLIEDHFAKGADYTTAQNACIGLNVETINSNALRTIKQYFPRADYSEYMTYYVTNNPAYFTINRVELPARYSRDYRITLDYQEDLNLFNQVEAYFKEKGLDYSTDALFEFLDSNPELAASNQHLAVIYKDDDDLIQRINAATTIKVDK